MKSKPLNVRQKNRWKATRTVLQVFVLLWAGWWIYSSIYHTQAYVEPDRSTWQSRDGFIALSYFGVNRTGGAKLVDKELLEEHLQTLSDQGYVTISQQDILNYYQEGTPLPEKALFLAFEDGRNDSALYAEPILEDLSYKATMMTYAEKMENHERKFLRPKDLKKMQKTGYWEWGTNGYRLSYINLFDAEGRFMDVMDDSEMKKEQDIEKIAYYNHYLMDFIRDENMIPVEDRTEMSERIDRDYELLEKDYIDALGEVPRTYMIMHANALYGGMNRLVEEANVRNIERLFQMHFNREGTSYNTGDESLYNLTRLQVAPYWSTNHLLMKIQKDTGQKAEFIAGDEDQAQQWELVSGAVQFKGERIILTSPPGQAGMMILKQSGDDKADIRLTAELAGNVVGQQSFYVRYDRKQDAYVRIRIHDNRLIVEQKSAQQEQPETIYDQRLGEVHWSSEDLAFDKASVYTREQTAAGSEIEYDDEGEYPINIQQTRKLEITVQDDRLTVIVDDEKRLDQHAIDGSLLSGGVALQAEYSEMNLKDDIYDAIFDRMTLEAVGDQGEVEETLYSNRLTGIPSLRNNIEEKLDSLVNWAIDAF
ncbi:polysaccharide deacetylase family protein [Marinicrinis lubricantis]|uniref:Polysaccharide deacetylase family protein n=1 Tax=Marinicrinis lubricantis TaxID=2086470 RepID=A0ABW1IRU9_9BACL